MNKIQAHRLLNVARSLRESSNPGDFTMEYYCTNNGRDLCGTPQCALGHYASRPDLQKLLKIEVQETSLGSKYARMALVKDPPKACMFDTVQVVNHFGLDLDEMKELFDFNGCGKAKTALQAAKYIENFVAERTPAQAVGLKRR